MFKHLIILILLSFCVSCKVNKIVKTDPVTLKARHKFERDQIASTAKLFEAHTFVDTKGNIMNYRLLKPLNYNPKKIYPLVVSLSGSGGRGTDNVVQIAASWSAIILAKKENRTKYSAFVLVPQCPPNSGWGKNLGALEKIEREKRNRPNLKPLDTTVFEIIDILKKEYKIDLKRLYVTGQSMGGYGTWHFIQSQPKTFAAAIPICGGGNPDLAHKIIDVPIWAFHGEKDTSIPASFSRNMISALQTAGSNPKYTEFANVGHICWPLVYDNPEVLKWLFDQKNSN